MAGGSMGSGPSLPSSARGAFYGRENIGAWNIVAQIALIQLTFYVSFFISLLFTNFLSGSGTTSLLDQMLSPRSITFSNLPGWSTTVAFAITALGPVTAAIVMVVGRSRKCLDFAATTFCIHLAASTTYDGLPKTGTWWFVVVSAGAAVTTVGELLCARKERMEIPLTTDSPERESGE